MEIVGGTTYRDVEIYEIAHTLGVETHHFSLTLPIIGSVEKYHRS
jgi:hypothetical protein